eukprot:41607_1
MGVLTSTSGAPSNETNGKSIDTNPTSVITMDEENKKESIVIKPNPKQLSRQWIRTVKRLMRQLERSIRKTQQTCKKMKAEMTRLAQQAHGDQQKIRSVRWLTRDYVLVQNRIPKIYECKATLNAIAVELKEYNQNEDKQLLTMGFLKNYGICIVELQIPSVIVYTIALFYEFDFVRKPSPEITAKMDKLRNHSNSFYNYEYVQTLSTSVKNMRTEMESAGLVTPYYPIMREPWDEPCDEPSEDELEEQIGKVMQELPIAIHRCSGCGEYPNECSCDEMESMLWNKFFEKQQMIFAN